MLPDCSCTQQRTHALTTRDAADARRCPSLHACMHQTYVRVSQCSLNLQSTYRGTASLLSNRADRMRPQCAAAYACRTATSSSRARQEQGRGSPQAHRQPVPACLVAFAGGRLLPARIAAEHSLRGPACASGPGRAAAAEAVAAAAHSSRGRRRVAGALAGRPAARRAFLRRLAGVAVSAGRSTAGAPGIVL